MKIKVVKRFLKLIGFNILVFCFLLLLLEVGLHLLFVNTKHPRIKRFASYQQLLKRNKTPIYTPHRYLGYIPTPGFTKGQNRHNQLGYRGAEIAIPKPDSTFRIICLGGSTTYTVKIEDYKKSYPTLLGELLRQKGFNNVEVVNSGVGGWSSWESFINLQLRLLSLEPDLLVVYHGINDVHARVVWPPETYQSDNSGRRIAKAKMNSPWWQCLALRSNIIRVLQVSTGKKAPARAFRSFDDYPPSLHMYELDQQLKNHTYPSGIFSEIPLAKMLQTNQPVHFRKNLEGIVTLAQANDIPIMLSTFAYLQSDQDYITTFPAYQTAIAEQNALVHQISQQKKVPLLNFAKICPQDSSLYADAIHVNEKGSALKAKFFADFIEDNFLKRIAEPMD